MRVWAVALSFLLFLLTLSGAEAEQRIALVIGNGACRSMPARENAIGDAAAIAALLRTIGFEVIEATNLTQGQMRERILEFGKKTEGADVALFYYAGQAVALDDENYLLATDSDIGAETAVKMTAVSLETSVFESMRSAHVHLVFFDAPRTSPFAAGRRQKYTRPVLGGDFSTMHEPQGGLVAYASAPGQAPEEGPKGGHSPFTRALLDHITEPGVEIQRVMTEVRVQVSEQTNKRQLPWGNTDLIGAVYLNPQPAPAGPK
jgi:uncharacterized caspase-like protein